MIDQLQYRSDSELYEIIDEARRLLAERREQKIAAEAEGLKVQIKAAFETIVPIQAEYDAAKLPIQKESHQRASSRSGHQDS